MSRIIKNISDAEFRRIVNGTDTKINRTYEEHDIQSACVKWFRKQYNQYALVLFAIPNGSYKSKTSAAKMNAEGLTAGVADLCLAVSRGGYGALYIEMKRQGGYQKPNQKEWQERCEAAGNKYVVCRSILEFMQEVNSYLSLSNPLADIKVAYADYELGIIDGSTFKMRLRRALNL